MLSATCVAVLPSKRRVLPHLLFRTGHATLRWMMGTHDVCHTQTEALHALPFCLFLFVWGEVVCLLCCCFSVSYIFALGHENNIFGI